MTPLRDDDSRSFAEHLRDVVPRTHGRVLSDVEVESISIGVKGLPWQVESVGVVCPECAQGKCVNCTGDVLVYGGEGVRPDYLEPCAHRVDKVHP